MRVSIATTNYQPMVYRDKGFTKNDIKSGHFYITNDNRILMYLGVDSEQRDYLFYETCGCLPARGQWYLDNGEDFYLAHHDIQISSTVELIDRIMQEPVDSNCLLRYRNVPRIVSSFDYIDKEKDVERWYEEGRSKLSLTYADADLIFTTSSVEKGLADNSKLKSPYVSAKELQPGHLYYGGSLWRNLYCYLGRDSQKDFCWAFIGNEEALLDNPEEYLSDSIIEKTKSNKKVKPIEYAKNDIHAYVCREVEPFLDGSFCADVSKIDLDFDLNRGFYFDMPSF